MDLKIKNLLKNLDNELASRAANMTEQEHAEAWHAIESRKFAVNCDDSEHFQERRMEEMMLGNWDYENNHTID